VDYWGFPKFQHSFTPMLHPQSLIAEKAATVFDLKNERKPLLSPHYDVSG
jgi:hypothetical protein